MKAKVVLVFILLLVKEINVIISYANINDAQEILDLQKLAYQIEAKRYNDYTLPPLTQTLEEIQTDFQKMAFLKAVIEGKIIGSVRAYLADNTCFIGRLIVHPDFQNQGVGTKLMNEIEDRFKQAKRFELFTGHKSEGPLHIYHKLGYQEFKRKDLDTHTLVFLEKTAR
jgi:ribosomal protein S18 acetylase RimI-like enzyme